LKKSAKGGVKEKSNGVPGGGVNRGKRIVAGNGEW